MKGKYEIREVRDEEEEGGNNSNRTEGVEILSVIPTSPAYLDEGPYLTIRLDN